MHVTIGLDGSPPLSDMEWWIVGQEGQQSDEESHNGTPVRDDQSMELDLESSLQSNEGSMKEVAPLSTITPRSEEEHDSRDSSENYPPFDSRTGSPLPSISNESLKEPSLAHQHGCQVPYATFHLHPDAVLDNDSDAAPPPPILHDSDSGSSTSDVEWETIHRPLEHVVDGMIEAG